MSKSAVCASVVLASAAFTSSIAAAAPPERDPAAAKHVLLISVDGLHQSDLAKYAEQHHESALAHLVRDGVDYTAAQTPVPSDSFPGMVAQVTGGNPRTTGVYYDDSYNRSLLAPGTTSCAGVAPGAQVELTEALDKNPDSIDAGQGLSGLPAAILSMTGNPRSVIDPSKLPVDPKTCTPVSAHDYLQVNTVFQVAKQAGLRTAWSDKHAAYDILNGPGSIDPSIDDLFTPEVNSQADGVPAGKDWTKDNAKTQQYDGYKVQAVLNEIDGYDHSRTTKASVPAIFGLNFQSVSTAQKLPASGGKPGGYLADGATPGPVLASALDFVDTQVGRIVDEIHSRHREDDTTIILSAKHGQSPMNPATLTRIDDQPIIDGLNAAWAAAHPGTPALVAHAVDDDAMIMWFSDRSSAAAAFAKDYLLHHNGVGADVNGQSKPYTGSGVDVVHAGVDAAAFFGTAPSDARVPDLYAIAQHGVVFTGGKGKIAEHGGAGAEDRNVPIVIRGEGAAKHGTVTAPVETTQIAPTILTLLGLDPLALQAVRSEHTAVLPETTGQSFGSDSLQFGS
ncbi:alkaline phosphatase family protein [Rhodococcus spelaei]|uniref:alkaline phosphatase family protein n=1 Tax=Rhodococcus spelaei TaxID=2546320 RepID=UPI001FECAD9E|nr:alkaline phosphatase family protein [Rhodococcus spelaei]